MTVVYAKIGLWGGEGKAGRQTECLMCDSKIKNCDRYKNRKFFGS